jgi:hypothetical protein
LPESRAAIIEPADTVMYQQNTGGAREPAAGSSSSTARASCRSFFFLSVSFLFCGYVSYEYPHPTQ